MNHNLWEAPAEFCLGMAIQIIKPRLKTLNSFSDQTCPAFSLIQYPHKQNHMPWSLSKPNTLLKAATLLSGTVCSSQKMNEVNSFSELAGNFMTVCIKQEHEKCLRTKKLLWYFRLLSNTIACEHLCLWFKCWLEMLWLTKGLLIC